MYEFKAWLQQKPLEWSISLSARAVLRVVPIAYNDADFAAVILPVFRAAAIARYAAKYPSPSLAKAAADASRGARPILRAALSAAASVADTVSYLDFDVARDELASESSSRSARFQEKIGALMNSSEGSTIAAYVAGSAAADAINAASDCVAAYAPADKDIFLQAV
ncbi:hypothetical protein LPW26_04950 [Rhodopseudomonas sp. HC1]|uniref:hypothetical protein n=1 Tax=Rhodopseudomonas infernalis TaxID=2897386 RepID=UPI001EE89426|nr:hypothetical protein [Rhodopseudomonas infernalis]MCG6203973.1 hypothetical protein [Rhodopseudomonas infernalis]